MGTELRQIRGYDDDYNSCYYQVEIYHGKAPAVTPTGMKPGVKYLHRTHGPAVTSHHGLVWDFYLYGVKVSPTYIRDIPGPGWRHIERLDESQIPRVDMFGNPLTITSPYVEEERDGSLVFECKASKETREEIWRISRRSLLRIDKVQVYPDGRMKFPMIYEKHCLPNGDIKSSVYNGYEWKTHIIKPNGDVWHYLDERLKYIDIRDPSSDLSGYKGRVNLNPVWVDKCTQCGDSTKALVMPDGVSLCGLCRIHKTKGDLTYCPEGYPDLNVITTHRPPHPTKTLIETRDDYVEWLKWIVNRDNFGKHVTPPHCYRLFEKAPWASYYPDVLGVEKSEIPEDLQMVVVFCHGSKPLGYPFINHNEDWSHKKLYVYQGWISWHDGPEPMDLASITPYRELQNLYECYQKRPAEVPDRIYLP